MALNQMRLGRRKEKAGFKRNLVIRHRKVGDPIRDDTFPTVKDPLSNAPQDTRSYIDVEFDRSGKQTTVLSGDGGIDGP